MRAGIPVRPVAALAQVPELLQVAVPFIGAALGPSGIDWRSKEIVIVRTSALAGGHYCVAAHTVVALDAGLDRREVTALRGELPTAQVFTLLARARPAAVGRHGRGGSRRRG